MNDAVDRLIVEREAMDHGLQGGILLSVFAHVLLIAAAVLVPLLAPAEPPLRVMDGFSVPMPPGGGGPANLEPAAGPPQPDAPAPKPEPPPKFIKPPSKSEPPKTRGLPRPDAKKKKAGKDEPRGVADAPANPPSKAPASGAATPGLEFGPPGPGVPGGTDWLGDWYLAGVQRKIWSIWMQQIKADFNQPVTVRFTILQDGSLGDVDVVQPSGATLLELAAKRAVYSAAPFGPLPKSYGTTSYTIHAIFKPSS